MYTKILYTKFVTPIYVMFMYLLCVNDGIVIVVFGT